MGLSNQISLVWVPGHSGVEGNERVDELAKVGSETLTEGLEPRLPIPQSICAKAMKDWVMHTHAERWTAYDGGAHTKHFFPKPDPKWTKIMLTMDRNRIRRVVGAITGHCGLNRHMERLRLSVTPKCDCGFEDETGIHIICECPKFAQLRHRLLGDCVVTPPEVVKMGPVILDRFLEATGRFT